MNTRSRGYLYSPQRDQNEQYAENGRCAEQSASAQTMFIALRTDMDSRRGDGAESGSVTAASSDGRWNA